MAATTAALALSSAARQLSRSASSILMRQVSGSHKLTIDGYSASRKIPQGQLPQAWWCANSQPFEAAGYTWRISSYFPIPNGRRKEAGGDDNDCISMYLVLADEDDDDGHNHPVPVQLKLSLLDLAGTLVPGYTRSTEGCVFWRHPTMIPTSDSIGFYDFVKWKDLHESGALNDDRFAIRCDITAIVTDWSDEPDSDDGGAPVSSTVVVPPSDLHQQLSHLLWKHKHGADVAIDVAGETFDAHGWLLAARSPVFQAMLQMLTVTSSKKEKKEPPSGVAAHRTITINGMEPKVFKAMLHFMYTDALPQDGDDGVGVEMARGLLVAAHRYKLERLKLMCEEALCRRINVDTVAAILVAAEEHWCQALKASCVAFMVRPGCMKAVMETRGFEEVKATCLPLLLEILVKQLA